MTSTQPRNQECGTGPATRPERLERRRPAGGAAAATMTPGADPGSDSFSLTPGAYTIREVCPAGEGWRQSQPGLVTSADGCGNNTYSINLGSGESDTNNDFGNFRNFTKSGVKFHDHNANGVRDAGDEGLSGWTIQALQGGAVVATTTTGADGSYSFSLTPGAYTIREVCPAARAGAESQPGPVTSADGCGNNTYSINLGSGEWMTTTISATSRTPRSAA